MEVLVNKGLNVLYFFLYKVDIFYAIRVLYIINKKIKGDKRYEKTNNCK